MPNPKGNAVSLKPADSPWKNKPTKTIRVPVMFADELLEKAHQLDEGGEISSGMIDRIQADIHKAMKLVNGITFRTGSLYVVDRKTRIKEFNQIMETLCQSLEELKTVTSSDKMTSVN